MNDLAPRGPGRPRKDIPDAITEDGEAVPVSRRRKRAGVNGIKLKLDAPQRPGFHRRWVDNAPSRILELEELGYSMVADKASEGASRTDGLGSRISRHAGKRENGEPHHLVLMECCDEDYAIGVAEKEDRLKPFEAAIRAGRDTSGQAGDSFEVVNRDSSLTRSG